MVEVRIRNPSKEHVPFSTSSMASSKAWYFHFFLLVTRTLLTCGFLWFGLDAGRGETFSLSNAC
jgi:hypothetical protein